MATSHDPIPDFTPDCASCAGLCCVAFAFDRSDDFGHDKEGDEKCRYLASAYRCTIHADLTGRGYAGCVRFDCLGAGQRVTRDLFGGGDWQRDPSILAPMTRAFRAMRRIHEDLQLLATAATLPLSPAEDAERRTLIERRDGDARGLRDASDTTALERHAEQVQQFLRRLSQHGLLSS